MDTTFYRVSIANATAAAPQNGFVDAKPIERYLAEGAAAGLSLATSQAKERANLRYDSIVNSMAVMANCYVTNIVATGASGTAEASPFAFTVEVEQGDNVLSTPDELNVPAILTGAPALRRCVARGLMMGGTSGTTMMFDYYDPSASVVTPTIPVGSRLDLLTVRPPVANLAAAEALVTVTKIANV